MLCTRKNGTKVQLALLNRSNRYISINILLFSSSDLDITFCHVFSKKYLIEVHSKCLPCVLSTIAKYFLSGQDRGHPFMTSQKIKFLTPLSTWAGPPLWTSTRGRHEIHPALLKWLVQ